MADEADKPLAVTAEQLGITFKPQSNDQLDYDLGNLTAHDPAPINPEDFAADKEAKCLELATAITQSLIGKLFELPSQPVQGGRVANLPKPTTVLPREKPIPKPKPLTKWQKFAQKKGIVKKKRSKLVYDEDADEWRRRHGYKKAGDPNDVQVIEAGKGDKVGEDPFSEMAKAKKERVKKQNRQQAENLKTNLKSGHALPVTLKLAAALPENGKGAPPTKRKDLKDDIKALSRHSGIATASMGKFDRRLKGEKEGERQVAGKRRKFTSVTDTRSERNSMTSMADKFLRERSDDIIDVKKAIGKFEAAAREERNMAKKEGGRQKAGKVPKARGGVGKKPGKSAARGKKK